LSSASQGGLVAVSFIGTAVGLLVFGDVADRIGRKKVFAFNLWVFIVSALLASIINSVWMLWAVRFLIGIAIGMDLPTSAAFLAEVSPKARRGRIAGSLPNLTWVGGAIVSILLALALEPISGNSTWRWMFAFAAIPSALVLLARHFLPESPRWLMANGREEEARAVFKALDLDEESLVVKKEKKPAREYRKLLHGKNLRRMLTVTAFFVLNTTAGPIVTFMGPTVLAETGISVEQNLYISLGSNIIALIALLIGAMIIDRVNRRTLGLVAAAVLTGAALCVGLFGGQSTTILIIGFVIWSFTTQLGPAVLAWVWSVEAYPTELRGFGSGITQSCARMFSALTAAIIPGLVHSYGMIAIAPFSAVYLLMFLVVLANPWLASTGKSLEETTSVAELAAE
jgi:putative MFS transporter